MMRIEVNEDKCLLSEHKGCNNCVTICPSHVLGIREGRIKSLRPEECISCHCCKGTCPAGLDVITVEEMRPLERKDVRKRLQTWDGLKIPLGRLTISTPLIIASGPIGRCSRGWLRARAEGCGAVVTKTTTPIPWRGNPAIRLLPYQKDMILNCEGLPNLGAEAIAREIQLAKTLDPNLILIPSIAAYTKEEYIRMAILLEDAGADGLEIPLMGCPNYRADNPVAQAWNENPQQAYDLVNGLRKALKLSLWVKGAQNLEMARACEEAGADALLIRSGSLRAIALDPLTGKPLLSHPWGEGSLAGPYTKLPGLKIVAEMVGQLKIPIIGNGGITCGQDVIDYLRVGASAVELLTVIIRKGLSVLPKILCEIEAYLKRHGYKNIGEIRGESLQYIKK